MNIKPSAVIFDIDGTLANIQHRQHYVTNKPKNWSKFNEMMIHDQPYDDMINLVNIFRDNGDKIIVTSGREDRFKEQTETWFMIHGILVDKLYMRPANDFRTDWIVKEEMLDKILEDYAPWLVFDDRDQVVDMWRRNGLRCLQVAPGDF